MSAIAILLIGFILLFLGYIFYGKWLAKQWGLEPDRSTPAHDMQDGKDYVPAKAPVLLGHHFSSIAGAGPVNGPIQAAIFGWLPVFLWIVIGGIFIGATHDFGALLASIRHKGHSIGEVIAQNIGYRAKRLFIIFSYLVLLIVVAAFASIVAGAFASGDASSLITTSGSTDASIAAMTSILFIVLAIFYGGFVLRKNLPTGVPTAIGVAGIALCIVLGLNFGLNISQNTWMIIIAVYIIIASVTPVWILLQPRDYLSSFLLYAMMLAAIIGVFGSNPTLEIPAFVGFQVGTSYLFPTLFITVACGAISGFHSLIGSGTTSKQLDREGDAFVIGFGGMLIECALAIIALCAVGYVWAEYSSGEMTNPTTVFATGVASMLQVVGAGSDRVYSVTYALVILAVSTFALTTLDTVTRLGRYMFEEFWTREGESAADLRGYRAFMANPYVSTLITVGLGVGLGMGGYAKIWPLLGASNQLLAVLSLIAIASWLGNTGKNNKMLFIPMIFMLVATLSSLALTIKTQFGLIIAGSADISSYLQTVFAVILFILALVLVTEGYNTLKKKKSVK